MKSIIKISIILIIGLGFSIQAKAEKSHINQTQKDPIVVTDTFSVSNMSCHKDANLVSRSLYRLKGVKKVQIIGDKVVVKYDQTKQTSKQIIAAIEATGTCEDPNDKQHKAKKK